MPGRHRERCAAKDGAEGSGGRGSFGVTSVVECARIWVGCDTVWVLKVLTRDVDRAKMSLWDLYQHQQIRANSRRVSIAESDVADRYQRNRDEIDDAHAFERSLALVLIRLACRHPCSPFLTERAFGDSAYFPLNTGFSFAKKA